MKKFKLVSAVFILFFGFVVGTMAMGKFSDVSGHWAEKEIDWAAGRWLIQGDEGRNTFRPDDSVTRAELVTVLNRYDSRAKQMMALMEEGGKMAQGEVVERGYFFLADEKTSEDGKYKYQVYSKEEPWCSTGYLNENAPIHCLLRVTDLKTQQLILELESNEEAEFELNGETFVAPKDWYDNESLFIEDGFGDGGIAWGSGKTYKVDTGEFKLLFDYGSDSSIGHLVFEGDSKGLFFHQSEEGFNVYRVENSIDSLYDLCVDDHHICAKIDFSALTKVNELKGATWLTYKIGKGIIVSTTDSQFIYNIEKNEFLPYQE